MLLSRSRLVDPVTVRDEVGPSVSSRGWVLIKCILVLRHRVSLLVSVMSQYWVVHQALHNLFLNSCLLPLLKSARVLLLWPPTCASGTGITVHFKIALDKTVLCQAGQHFASNMTLFMTFFSPKKMEIITVRVSVYCRNNGAHRHILTGQISENHTADLTVASGLTSHSLPAGQSLLYCHAN